MGRVAQTPLAAVGLLTLTDGRALAACTGGL
jgi:hypothetical protein